MWLWEEQGGLLGPFSFLLLLLLLVTRSPFNACLFTGSLYLLLRLFSFEPVPSRRALQVLKPRDRVSAIAHRGGSHDAPENTLAAIRLVSPPRFAPPTPAPPGRLYFCLTFRRFSSILMIPFVHRECIPVAVYPSEVRNLPTYLYHTANTYIFAICQALRTHS